MSKKKKKKHEIRERQNIISAMVQKIHGILPEKILFDKTHVKLKKDRLLKDIPYENAGNPHLLKKEEHPGIFYAFAGSIAEQIYYRAGHLKGEFTQVVSKLEAETRHKLYLLGSQRFITAESAFNCVADAADSLVIKLAQQKDQPAPGQ